jgi:hypothetical protein
LAVLMVTLISFSLLQLSLMLISTEYFDIVQNTAFKFLLQFDLNIAIIADHFRCSFLLQSPLFSRLFF